MIGHLLEIELKFQHDSFQEDAVARPPVLPVGQWRKRRQHCSQRRSCPLCEIPQDEAEYRHHRGKCVIQLEMDNNGESESLIKDAQDMAIFWQCTSAGVASFAMIGGFQPQKLVQKWKSLETSMLDAWDDDDDQAFGKTLALRASGPKPNSACKALAKPAGELIRVFASTCTLMPTSRVIASPLFHSALLDDLFSLSDNIGKPGGPTMRLHKRAAGSLEAQMVHGPPPFLAALIGDASCHETCNVCAVEGCLACPGCALKLRGGGPGMLLIMAWQRKAVVQKRVWLCIGSNAFDIAEGISAIFDSSYVPFGVWCPESFEAYSLIEVNLSEPTRHLLGKFDRLHKRRCVQPASGAPSASSAGEPGDSGAP